MGSGNSKPDDVSDAAWDKVQQQKLELIATREEEIKELKKKRQAKVNQFTIDVGDYCNKCHDVPRIMMLLPSYRKECSEARAKVLGAISEQINVTESIATAVHISNAIKRSY